MFTAVVVLLSVLLMVVHPLEGFEATYLEDPSSQNNLTCNPYGREIHLYCTIEEPLNLKIASNLLLLWYWTPPGAQPVNDSCQIYPQYQCHQYVGRNKYDFLFERSSDPNNRTLSVLRKVHLMIHNVGLEDQGCYNCRPWLNSSPLPAEESSGLFCLEPNDHYKHLQPCSIGLNVVTTSDVQIAPSSVTSSFSSFSGHHGIISTTNTRGANAPLVNQSETKQKKAFWEAKQNETKQTMPWEYFVTIIGVCVGLCLLAFIIQTSVIAYQCYWRMQHSHTLELQTNCNDRIQLDRNNVVQVTESCANDNIGSPETNGSQHFIGTYSYIKPHQNDEYQYPINNGSAKNTGDTGNVLSTGEKDCKLVSECAGNNQAASEGDVESLSISLLSPGVHIYQTLDKYLEQLANNPNGGLTGNETRTKQGMQIVSQQSYDQLFDDPNYSQVEAIEGEDSSMAVTSGGLSSPTSPDNYDKLQPKLNDSEYAYAYSHIMKFKKQLKNLKRTDRYGSHPRFRLELLHVAAMGTYEMDPKLVTEQLEDTETPSSRKSNPDAVLVRLKAIEEEKRLPKLATAHQYQSLDESTLNQSSNGYAHLVK